MRTFRIITAQSRPDLMRNEVKEWVIRADSFRRPFAQSDRDKSMVLFFRKTWFGRRLSSMVDGVIQIIEITEQEEGAPLPGVVIRSIPIDLTGQRWEDTGALITEHEAAAILRCREMIDAGGRA